jgi:general secretion pathway protein G
MIANCYRHGHIRKSVIPAKAGIHKINKIDSRFRGNDEKLNARRCPHTNGFTLTELLVVLVIIGLLAALVGPVLYQRINPAKESVARAQMENFMTGLDSYFLDVGKFPTTQQGLVALRTHPEAESKWNGPYLKKELPSDPWGNAYLYRAPGRNGGYEILSYGADGKEGGESDNADITSWEAKK